MSTIDQAFIRAYDDVYVVPKAVSWPKEAPRKPDVPKPTSHEPAPTFESMVSSSAAGFAAVTVAIIDVGVSTYIPAPHAAFLAHAVRPEVKPVAAASPMAPLSALAKAINQPAPTATIKPALEVDKVRWPAVCGTLLEHHASRLDALIEEIREQSKAGHRVVAVSGTRKGEGRTTLTLCLARRLAAMNLKVAVVDADFANPGAARQLGIAVERGWETVLTGEETLSEIMIELLADRFALLPLGAAAREIAAEHSYRVAATLHELAEHYDVVLVDAGPLDAAAEHSHWLLEAASGVDAVLLAHDVRRGGAAELAATCLRLAEARQRQIGIAEMFVDASA